nr:MAG TPA: hypothetical protein [Caudoviricetes sp.]
MTSCVKSACRDNGSQYQAHELRTRLTDERG